MKPHCFIKRFSLNVSAQNTFRWHSRFGALERLSPPWAPLRVVKKTGGIEPGARVVLKMPLPPLPLKVKWIAEHTDYEEDSMFRDRQIKGPFSFWEHTHRFIPDGLNRCFLEDQVKYALPLHPVSTFCFRPLIKNELERIFTYRHSTTASDLNDHQQNRNGSRLTILISGASGLIGTALIPFLTTGGHRVIRLVRRQSIPEADEISWDPVAGKLNLEGIDSIDAVIHLTGENIGEGRWTTEKKQKIIHSRNKSTALLSEALSRLDHLPKVFVCASAIGFYGDRGSIEITEEDTCGADFISGVCSEWEQSADPARKAGIRSVFLRIGVVLSPQGGALQKLLLPFKLCLGAKIGSGEQYMSWIGIDDVIGTIYHVIYNEQLNGPVNITAPEPVTNSEFTKILGRILKRPSFFRIPEGLIKLKFGEMGKEILLSSTRVRPDKLLESGYEFRHPMLKGVLEHLLGKVKLR